ncbi:MAG: exodeoxyribonuclease III [Acidimicrobiales bacterium]
MKVVTWNVNSLTARYARVTEWITANSPDVVLLQETKMTDAKFPTAGFAELGYESAHYGQGQWNGVAVLSRVGLEDVSRGFGDEDPEARLIGATCAGVRVYSCYVPNGRALDDDHYIYKLRWLAALAALLAERTQPTIAGGDFNVAPTDLDCYNPAAFAGATHVSAPERAALAAIEATGLVDITRRLHRGETIYSWWDYRYGAFHRGWGLRIDLLYLDESLAVRASASYVDRNARKGEKPSDHAPVVVEID